MLYRPPRTLGVLVGSLFTLWAAGVAAVLFGAGLAAGLGVVGVLACVGAVLAAGLALLFAYWTFALGTLAYAIDRNGLVIHWGATRQVVPLGAIERLVPGTAVGVPPVRGVTWWGYQVGSATIARLGEVLFYSTHQSPDQVLYVITSERNYAISVDDPSVLAREVLRRQELGPTAELDHRVRRGGLGALPLWQDRAAHGLIALALAATAAMWLYVGSRYGGLPEALALHFPPTETPPLPRLVARSELLELPRTATLLLGINLVGGALLHRWERVAAYLVFFAAAVVQVLFLAATAIAIA